MSCTSAASVTAHMYVSSIRAALVKVWCCKLRSSNAAPFPANWPPAHGPARATTDWHGALMQTTTERILFSEGSMNRLHSMDDHGLQWTDIDLQGLQWTGMERRRPLKPMFKVHHSILHCCCCYCYWYCYCYDYYYYCYCYCYCS